MTSPASKIRPWLHANIESAVHLVLCPFAGASGSAFSSWHSLTDLYLNVSLAVYPGRDHRMKEPPATSIELLAEEVAFEIAEMPREKRELILLGGHSMGAQVAFEACLKLETRGYPPAAVLLSGCHAPHLTSRRKLSHLSDHAFIEELISIGGCDPLLQEQPTLLRPFLPMLRADFAATESYHRDRREDAPKLNTPALLVYGAQDTEASREEVSAWSQWIDYDYRIYEMAGDHFYITQRPLAFASKVVEFYFRCFAFAR